MGSFYWSLWEWLMTIWQTLDTTIKPAVSPLGKILTYWGPGQHMSDYTDTGNLTPQPRVKHNCVVKYDFNCRAGNEIESGKIENICIGGQKTAMHGGHLRVWKGSSGKEWEQSKSKKGEWRKNDDNAMESSSRCERTEMCVTIKKQQCTVSPATVPTSYWLHTKML